MTLIARCSRSALVSVAVMRATLPTEAAPQAVRARVACWNVAVAVRQAAGDMSGAPYGAERIDNSVRNSRTDAVKPCRKLRAPMGPISPAQNIPAVAPPATAH